MPRIGNLYKLWLKAHHLPPEGAEVTISRATVETLNPKPGQTEKKVVLAFKGRNRRLVLNDGNANRMLDIAGSDNTDDWTGLVVRLRPADYTTKKRTIILEAAGQPGQSKAAPNSTGQPRTRPASTRQNGTGEIQSPAQLLTEVNARADTPYEDMEKLHKALGSWPNWKDKAAVEAAIDLAAGA